MITATQKSFQEIYGVIKGYDRVLVLGCGTCVTVCMAGGEKEAGILASTIRLANGNEGRAMEVQTDVVERQCDREFYDPARQKIEWADVVLSMGCGVGVQLGAELFPGKRFVPALDTAFYGAAEGHGVWSERCGGCGQCVLADFGGICPIVRCSKSLLNGPCGGSQKGKCEVDPENTDCGWQLIYDRMKSLGMLAALEEIHPIKDWSTGRDGGPRRIVHEEAMP